MGVNLLGLTQGLNQGASDLSSGYYGAIGSAIARNLAQQKQSSETNLQTAQGNYFNGRNQTARAVATTRADGTLSVENTRAQAQLNIASMKAAGLLTEQQAGQPDATVRGIIRTMDALNSNSHLEQFVYGGVSGGQPDTQGGGSGGIGTAGINPMDPTQMTFTPKTPQGGGGMSGGGMPPVGPSTPGGVPGMTPGMFTLPGGAPSAPRVPGAPNLPGAGGPMIPQGGGPVAQNLPPPQQNFVPGTNPGMNTAGTPGAGPGMPSAGPSGAPAPRNPFNVSPVAASVINKNNADAKSATSLADLNELKTKFYPNLTTSQIAENLANTHLMYSKSKFTDVETGLAPSVAQAKIKLDGAMGDALHTNAGTNAFRAQVYGQTQPIIAGADVTRANAYAQGVNQTGTYQNSEIGLGYSKLGVDQQNANTAAAKVGSGGKPSAALDMSYVKEIKANMRYNDQMQSTLSSGKTPDGKTNLTDRQKVMMRQEILSNQQRNQELDRLRNPAGTNSGGGDPSDPMLTIGGITHPTSVWKAERDRRAAQ